MDVNFRHFGYQSLSLIIHLFHFLLGILYSFILVFRSIEAYLII